MYVSASAETSYECKLFTVAKFNKQGIPVLVKSTYVDTETQLTSGSAFINGNVIETGSSSSTSDSASAFILMA
jgi:hypothetical protein